jgi:SAM-dependent methyltransferase
MPAGSVSLVIDSTRQPGGCSVGVSSWRGSPSGGSRAPSVLVARAGPGNFGCVSPAGVIRVRGFEAWRSNVVFVINADRPDLGGNMRHGDLHTWVPHLWRYLVDRFAVSSVLDVGCGEGHAVKFFHRLGIYAHGIDGLRDNVQRSVVPIALHDLLSGPYIMPVDLVWSCEVAEHIAPDKVNHYLDTIANGRIVAMTHALPGQGGHNHVNCQPSEYWIEKMGARGFRLSEDNKILIEISGRGETWNYFSKSGLVFLRS